MLGLLQGAGYRITADADDADALIVNTCGFLGAAVEESLETLTEMTARKRDGKCKVVVATGCLPQRDAQLIKMRVPDVDAILGTTDFPQIVATLDEAFKGTPQTVKELATHNVECHAHAAPHFCLRPHDTAFARHAAVDGLR